MTKRLTTSPSKPAPVFPKKLSLAARTKLAEVAMTRFREALPEPRCELYYKTPYQLLVSVVLSAQTTDKMVNRCMEPLYKKKFDIKTVLRMEVDGLLEHIRSIGLAPTKAKHIYKLSEILRDQWKSEVPSTREALEALPGVGRKTANVVLAEIFREPTLAVDTHVYRLGYRLALHRETSPLKAEQELLKVIDKSFLPEAHHWLILHGRYTCKAQKPLCDSCQISDICPSYLPKKEAIKS